MEVADHPQVRVGRAKQPDLPRRIELGGKLHLGPFRECDAGDGLHVVGIEVANTFGRVMRVNCRLKRAHAGEIDKHRLPPLVDHAPRMRLLEKLRDVLIELIG